MRLVCIMHIRTFEMKAPGFLTASPGAAVTAMVCADMGIHLQVDSAAMAELKTERDVADRKVESLQMTLAALKDDHERLKGAEAALKAARANLKDREEKLRAMSKQLDAARSALRSTALHTLSCAA